MNFFESIGRAAHGGDNEKYKDPAIKYLEYCHRTNREELEREKREEERQDRIVDALELIAKGMIK